MMFQRVSCKRKVCKVLSHEGFCTLHCWQEIDINESSHPSSFCLSLSLSLCCAVHPLVSHLDAVASERPETRGLCHSVTLTRGGQREIVRGRGGDQGLFYSDLRPRRVHCLDTLASREAPSTQLPTISHP